MPRRALMRWVAPRLCVLALLLPGGVAEAAKHGAPASPSALPATSTTAPVSSASVTAVIPVAEVATRAAQVPELVRTLTEPIAETAETEVLDAVAHAHPDVLKQPPPQTFFKAFGDSAVNFELRAWTNHFERWGVIQTELAVGIYAALRQAGMTMPFPQREIRYLRDAADGSRGGAS